MLEIVAATDDVGEARSWELLLSAVTMPHRVVDRSEEALPFEEDDHHERFCLIVSDEDADRARALIDVNREEEAARKAAAPRVVVARATRLHGVLAAALLCALLLAIYLRTPGFDSPLSLKLRVDADKIFAGEWHRLLGAAFLHGDSGHLFSNLGFLLPLGIFAVERLGVGHFLFGFVWTATLGNAASIVWHGAPHISVGASGGVFGILGMLVGSSLAEGGRGQRRRRELLGAGLAFLGLTAFGAKSDMAAHVFGCIAGVAFGAAAIRWQRSQLLDTFFGLAAMAASVLVFL